MHLPAQCWKWNNCFCIHRAYRAKSTDVSAWFPDCRNKPGIFYALAWRSLLFPHKRPLRPTGPKWPKAHLGVTCVGRKTWLLRQIKFLWLCLPCLCKTAPNSCAAITRMNGRLRCGWSTNEVWTRGCLKAQFAAQDPTKAQQLWRLKQHNNNAWVILYKATVIRAPTQKRTDNFVKRQEAENHVWGLHSRTGRIPNVKTTKSN